MNQEVVEQKLTALFNKHPKPGASRHIVFWYDRDQDFTDVIDKLNLPENVKVVTVKNNLFHLKYLIEYENLESHFLLYFPQKKPADYKNWLLDMSLYSTEFFADPNSIILSELGIVDRSDNLIKFVSQYKKFFKSKKRLQDCGRLVHRISQIPDKHDLEKAMLVSLTPQQIIRNEDIIRAVLVRGLDENKNPLWLDIQKYELEEVFWKYVKLEFGYTSDLPSLHSLFTSLLITFTVQSITSNPHDDWNQYVLSIAENVTVFMNGWINHKDDHAYLLPLVSEVETNLNLGKRFHQWSLEELVEIDLFESVDKLVIGLMSQSVINDTNDHEKLLTYLRLRSTKYWHDKYVHDHQSLKAAILLKHLANSTKAFSANNANEMVEKYCNQWHELDTQYRYFTYHYYDSYIIKQDKELYSTTHNFYQSVFLDKLTAEWMKHLEKELAKDWWIAGVGDQKSFYLEHVESVVSNKSREKVFVIISDALRFEVGVELTEQLNKSAYGKADIKPLQSMLPSITSLGMAALLPHQNIQLEDNGQVSIDGKRCSSIEERDKTLKDHNSKSVAFSLNDFMKKSREEKRGLTQGLQVVYLYHNQIDAIGDNAKSEDQVFKACDSTIKTITDAVLDLTNTLSASNIIITSDHGFVFSDMPLPESELLPIEISEPLIKHKRYLITKKSQTQAGALQFNLGSITGQSDLNAVVPNGYIRYKTQGGGRKYVHGGHSLQEIIIPVITYKHIRKHQADETMPKKVEVELINKARQITTNIATFHFYQKQPVQGRYKPRKVKVGLWAKTNDHYETISDEAIVIFNKDNTDANDRKYTVNLTLKRIDYRPDHQYLLRLMDIVDESEYGIVYQEYDYQINILISHDF